MVSPYIYAGLEDSSKMLMRKGIKPNTPSRIINGICEYLHLTKDQLLSQSRKRELVEARQIAMAFIRFTNPKVSLKEIGTMFGDRDHSTVIYSVQNYEALYKRDKRFRSKVNAIKDSI